MPNKSIKWGQFDWFWIKTAHDSNEQRNESSEKQHNALEELQFNGPKLEKNHFFAVFNWLNWFLFFFDAWNNILFIEIFRKKILSLKEKTLNK